MSPARLVVVTLTAIACHGALAQSAVPPALEVQRLAPQLVGFAGSDANFQSLVNGLAQGTAVQISSALPNGFTQTVTFTPAAPMTPAQIAQVLEGARQQLIGLGIASPTAEQIGFTLMGGVVPTALGGTPVAGALRPNPPSIAAQIQQANAAGGSTTSATPGGTTTSATPGSTATSAILGGTATSATPAAPGAPVATTPPVTSAVNVQLTPTPTTAPGKRARGERARAAPNERQPDRAWCDQPQPGREHQRNSPGRGCADGAGRGLDPAGRGAEARSLTAWAACSTWTAGCAAMRAPS